MADTFGIASIEYAVEHLGSRRVIVSGHKRCGAVKAADDTDGKPGTEIASPTANHNHESKEEAQGSIPNLIAHIRPAVTIATDHADGDDLRRTAIVCKVQLKMANLRKRSSLLRSLIDDGSLRLAGCYDLDNGSVKFLNFQPKQLAGQGHVYKKDLALKPRNC